MSRPHLFHFALIGALDIENVSETCFNFWPINLMTIIDKKEKLFSAFKQLHLTAQLTCCEHTHTHCWETVLYAPLKKVLQCNFISCFFFMLEYFYLITLRRLPFFKVKQIKRLKSKTQDKKSSHCCAFLTCAACRTVHVVSWRKSLWLHLLQSLECYNVCTSLGCINSSELCVCLVVFFLACCCIACRSVFILMLFLLVSVCS